MIRVSKQTCRGPNARRCHGRLLDHGTRASTKNTADSSFVHINVGTETKTAVHILVQINIPGHVAFGPSVAREK
eukprot:1189342-Prorocentrum_minimum.AAC.5